MGQLSLLEGAFNSRRKKSRIDKLLKQIDQFVDWDRPVKEIEPLYMSSKRGRPGIPIIYFSKSWFLQ